jgi:hypothetical protein
MTASHRVFDAILPHAESGRFLVGFGLRDARLGGERAHPELRDRGIVALVSILVHSLPLRTAVVASSNDGAPRIVAWAAPRPEPTSRPDASHETHHLPLTDRDGSFAGCLQLETDGILRDDDLAFARAVAGEIARGGGVPAGVSSQRALLGSIDTLESATRLAAFLSTIASVCVIERDGSQIVSVPEVSSFVDHERISGLVEHLVGMSEGAWCADIERSCRTLVESDRALVAKLGLHSIVHVPIASENGRARVVLLGGDDDPPFHPTLVQCVGELARGGAESDGNALLYRAALAGVRYLARELTVVSHQRAALEGSFVTLIEPASVADPSSNRLREVRRAAARLSHVL